nr:hypothetical protein BaRGS_029373 [Batillaria attramentaria]
MGEKSLLNNGGVTFLNFTYNRAHINNDDFFRNVTGIDHLEIGDNEIRTLRQLSLYDNRLNSLPDGIFDCLANLTSLDLSRNNIQSWYVSNRSLFQNRWHGPYTCSNIPNTTLDSFYMNEQACLSNHYVYVSMVIFQAALLIVLFFTAVLHRYRWHIRLVLYEAFRGRGDRWRRLQENHFQYDVFVSYAEEDSGWVSQHLMPEFEDRLGLRLCLHQRDFIPGRHIVDNISECVENSKKVMMLFSSDFWGRLRIAFNEIVSVAGP